MSRAWLVIISFVLFSPAFAARVLPQNGQIGVLRSANFPNIVLSSDGQEWIKVLSLGLIDGSQSYRLSANVRVRDENNRFIVYGQLPLHRGKTVLVRSKTPGMVDEIMILTPHERKSYQARAKQLKKMQRQ